MARRGYGTLILGMTLLVTLIAGCQTVRKSANDEEQIRHLVNTFVEAGKQGDIEKVMSCIAEDFRAGDGMDKEGIRFELADAMRSRAEFSAADMKVNIARDGKTAEVEGVSVDYTRYVVTVAKRGGTWLAVRSREQ